MRIGLGTVQFGFDYGISNRTGQVSANEAAQILELAEAASVRILDTAPAYGTSEELLGELLETHHPFSIVTKIPGLPAGLDGAAETERWVVASLAGSLARLRATRVHGLLVHRANDLLQPRGKYVWRALEAVCRAGSTEAIGASVYTAQELDALLERYPLTLVQLPANVFDQRLVRSGHLERLKRLGIEVHARSVFLQGVLLMDPADLPPHLSSVRDALATFRSSAAAAGLTPIQAAIAYVLGLPEVDAAVVGVTTKRELAEILAAATSSVPRDWFAPFTQTDEQIVDPSRWPK